MSEGAEVDSIQPGRIGPAVRLRLEEREESLSPFAAKSTRGRGRTIPEDPSPLRTEYQRDRDRIVRSAVDSGDLSIEGDTARVFQALAAIDHPGFE